MNGTASRPCDGQEAASRSQLSHERAASKRCPSGPVGALLVPHAPARLISEPPSLAALSPVNFRAMLSARHIPNRAIGLKAK